MSGVQNFADPAYLARMQRDRESWVMDQFSLLSQSENSIDLTNLIQSKYHQYFLHIIEGANLTGTLIRLNNTGNAQDYAFTRSVNGAAETTSTSATNLIDSGTTDGDIFQLGWLEDVETFPRTTYSLEVDSQGTAASVAPRRANIYGKFNLAGTAFMTSIEVRNVSAGQNPFAINSIFGTTSFRERQTNQSLFWNSVGQETLGSTATELTVNVSTTRLLWVMFHTRSNGPHALNMRFNGNSAANYSMRFRENTGAETTLTSQNQFQFYNGNTTNDVFGCLFIAHLSGGVALVTGMLCQTVDDLSSTAPNIIEFAGKFAITDAITSISLIDSNNLDSGTRIRVWGF